MIGMIGLLKVIEEFVIVVFKDKKDYGLLLLTVRRKCNLKCPICKKIMVDCYQRWIKKNHEFEYMHCGIYFCRKHHYFTGFNGMKIIKKNQPMLAKITIDHDKEWDMEPLAND